MVIRVDYFYIDKRHGMTERARFAVGHEVIRADFGQTITFPYPD